MGSAEVLPSFKFRNFDLSHRLQILDVMSQRDNHRGRVRARQQIPTGGLDANRAVAIQRNRWFWFGMRQHGRDKVFPPSCPGRIDTAEYLCRTTPVVKVEPIARAQLRDEIILDFRNASSARHYQLESLFHRGVHWDSLHRITSRIPVFSPNGRFGPRARAGFYERDQICFSPMNYHLGSPPVQEFDVVRSHMPFSSDLPPGSQHTQIGLPIFAV